MTQASDNFPSVCLYGHVVYVSDTNFEALCGVSGHSLALETVLNVCVDVR